MNQDFHFHSLTPSEKRLLPFLVAGDSNKAIARKTGIAPSTVKVHLKMILRKLRMQNRTQIAVAAYHLGYRRDTNENGNGNYGQL